MPRPRGGRSARLRRLKQSGRVHDVTRRVAHEAERFDTALTSERLLEGGGEAARTAHHIDLAVVNKYLAVDRSAHIYAGQPKKDH